MIRIHTLASGSRGNCHLLTSTRTAPLLLECGIPIKSIRDGLKGHGYNPSNVAACLITHEHKDHCRSIMDLLKIGVPCYSSQGTHDAIGTRYYPGAYTLDDSVRWVSYWGVKAFPVFHDASEPIGFLVTDRDDTLLYMTDTFQTENRFAGLTHIMIEANYDEAILSEREAQGGTDTFLGNRLRSTHMSIDAVLDFLGANDLSACREIHLMHLSNAHSDADDFRRRVERETGVPTYVA